MAEVNVEERIKFRGDLKNVLTQVCQDFDLGDLVEYKIVEMGYEDFNIILTANQGKYFIKIFSDFRSDKECQGYIDRITSCLRAGVNVPKLYKANDGYLYMVEIDGYKFRLAVMEFIVGKSYYESQEKVGEDEKREIIRQAALINSIDFKPAYVYDSWAIVNFVAEYEKKREIIGSDLPAVIGQLYEQFKKVPIDVLPHCHVHGDIMTTNVIKDKNNKLYIVDFGCSNYYPRISELAVLLCDILFDNDKDADQQNYDLLLREYQRYIELTDLELKYLPLFRQVGFAMYVLNGLYEKKAFGNNSSENEHWISLGLIGLKS